MEATYFRMKGLTVLIKKILNKSYSVLIETCDVNPHLVPYVNDFFRGIYFSFCAHKCGGIVLKNDLFREEIMEYK